MPRPPRKISEYGYMHIYTRGVSKQILFEERKDYAFYVRLLKQFSEENHIVICAFCLMENHVHLLIFDEENNVSHFMQQLNMNYAGYFNRKYERTGPLFDGRFKSIPIENESYLLTVFRYVLNNPPGAAICPAAEYEYSSYNRYGRADSFVDTSVFQELLGSWEEYVEFINSKYENCLELEGYPRNDEWAKSVIQDMFQVESGTALKSFDFKSRNEALRLLKERGLTIKQIERLTGINRNIVQRA